MLAAFLVAGASGFAQVENGAGAPAQESETVGDVETETDEADDQAVGVDDESPDVDDQQVDQADSAYPEGTPQAPASSMAESKASKERTLPGGMLAVISYIILWLMTLGFVGLTARRQSQLSEELDSLERRMDSVLGEWDDQG